LCAASRPNANVIASVAMIQMAFVRVIGDYSVARRNLRASSHPSLSTARTT
jgi:hypothetical protein